MFTNKENNTCVTHVDTQRIVFD